MENKIDSFTLGAGFFGCFILSSVYSIDHFNNEILVQLKMIAWPLIFFTLASACFILSEFLKTDPSKTERVKNIFAFALIFLLINILTVIMLNYLNCSFKLYEVGILFIFGMSGISMKIGHFIKNKYYKKDD